MSLTPYKWKFIHQNFAGSLQALFVKYTSFEEISSTEAINFVKLKFLKWKMRAH